MSSSQMSAFDVRCTIAAMQEAERVLRGAALALSGCDAPVTAAECSHARGVLACWRERILAAAVQPVEMEPAP